MRCWAWVLPSHREIIAAHCLPHLSGGGADDGGFAADVLQGLARAAGPFGVAMAAALACGLTARRERERRGAVDALLHLVGNGGLDAGLLGRELRLLLTTADDAAGHDGAAGHVADSLASVGRGGAWHVVWAVAYGVVPGLLRAEPVPAGLPALLAVATEAAVAVGARADLPELTAAAARADGSPLHIEAARLARAIG